MEIMPNLLQCQQSVFQAVAKYKPACDIGGLTVAFSKGCSHVQCPSTLTFYEHPHFAGCVLLSASPESLSSHGKRSSPHGDCQEAMPQRKKSKGEATQCTSCDTWLKEMDLSMMSEIRHAQSNCTSLSSHANLSVGKYGLSPPLSKGFGGRR